MASKVGEVFRHNIQVYIRQFNVKISEIYLEIQKRLMKQTNTIRVEEAKERATLDLIGRKCVLSKNTGS
jgi:hypothetical protein